MKLAIEQLMFCPPGTEFCYNATIEGGIFGVFGVSGSGKSTLMKLICGIERAKSGRLVFNGVPFFDSEMGIDVPPNKRHVGVVFQEHHLFPHLTVEGNLRFGTRFASEHPIGFEDVVSLLELESLLKKKPARLSGGERQRTAIGRALLQQPRMLLLDEPFSNLDRSRRGQIISYLLKIHNRFEIPLMIISHDLEDILKLTQSLLIIENHAIVAAGEYLDMAARGVAPGLILPKRFLNIVELVHQRYLPKERMNQFGLDGDGESLLTTNSGHFDDVRVHGSRVRLCIAPDDIALSSKPVIGISMQNQLRGVVTEILHMNDSFYVTLDCGVKLVSEITPKALYQLDVKPGHEFVCLFKAKAVEVVHIFEK